MKQILLTMLCLGLVACAGSRPVQLGQVNTSLTPCPDKPNCVSSKVPKNDDHFIEPIPASKANESMKTLVEIINNTPRTEIIVNSDTYIYAEYTSKLMGFVDDVEFLYSQEESLIHVRSASRLGYRDFDVNRERVDAIRAQLKN